MNPRPQAPGGGSPSYTERAWTIYVCSECGYGGYHEAPRPDSQPVEVVEASALVAEREAREKAATFAESLLVEMRRQEQLKHQQRERAERAEKKQALAEERSLQWARAVDEVRVRMMAAEGFKADILERVAAALFEQATWHPPERGEDWADASEAIQERWRVEARTILGGEEQSATGHVLVRRVPLERLLAEHFSGGFQTNELGLAFAPDERGRMGLVSTDLLSAPTAARLTLAEERAEKAEEAASFALACIPSKHPEPCGTDACWLCAAETRLREALAARQECTCPPHWKVRPIDPECPVHNAAPQPEEEK